MFDTNPWWTRGAMLGLAALLTASAAHAQGNAFLPARGEGAMAISHTFESYDDFWRGEDEVHNAGVGRVETGTLSLWLQAGLTDDLAVVATGNYVDVRTDGTMGFAQRGLGDRSLSLRYRFLNSATSGGWNHRLVADAGVRFAGSGYDPNGPVALGDGTNDGLFRLVYQVQLDRVRGSYLALEGGLDVREDDAPENWLFGAELGATFSPADGGHEPGRGLGGRRIGHRRGRLHVPGPGRGPRPAGGKLHYRVSPAFGLGVSAFTILDGRNTGVSDGLSTSLVLNL